MTRATVVYDHLPDCAQTAAVTLYGLHNRRRLRGWMEVLERLEPSEHWSRDMQVQFVAQRLRTILQGAFDDVPRYGAYRSLKRQLAGPDNEVFEILRELPVLTKQEIVEEPQQLISKRFQRSTLSVSSTSGTTGTPMHVLVEPEARLTSDALGWRRTVWAGYQPGDWIARLVGDHVVPLTDAHPSRPHRVSWSDRKIYLSSYHLSEATADAMLAVLARRRPAFVMGYPSALDALASLGTQ